MSRRTSNPLKRLEMALIIHAEMGYVNRALLVDRFGMTQLQASVLLRELISERINDIKRDTRRHGYKLIR